MTDAVLANAHVLVVGGTGVIGKAVAGHTASAGARVTLTSRSADDASSAAGEFEGDVSGVAYDATDHATVSNLTDGGPFDHVVITAAALSFDSLTDIDSGVLDDLVASKLLGTMWTARHLRSHVDDKGSMLFVSGMLSRRPTQAAPLAAVNGAIESLGKALAHEYAPLRVNVVSPGGIGTEGLGGHTGAPGDVAALVTATLANPWINGTVLDIHGG
ncbi:SDR family NAD(P)-dependent oxidoreductase [Euzebya tangerina]|uniref:SDR family NAD(P)-dependent oxidoreductase n=1 Tax=Euzebya tangerina TaxID=591198 RepID=UPI000E31024D|nr:SDR family NAD(P)-dependent oxidoreductase [Euzebya tangerina]